MKITIIIPFYNEENRIVLESFHQIFKNSLHYDFILVDEYQDTNEKIVDIFLNLPLSAEFKFELSALKKTLP